ncbi:hypothetical protein BDFG_07752 [Blastomyces dermatitidis ATCC 26199]|nr:hypothetical protein BDFG_07752 [Blastomyces dermatitidis ATCC 26199]
MTAVKEAEKELNTDELTGRRDNISLQDAATITAAARDAEEEEDMTMKTVLSQLIDTVIFIFNLAFLAVTETAAVL